MLHPAGMVTGSPHENPNSEPRMRIIDLSHEIHEGISVYPGTEAPSLVQANRIETDGFAEMRLAMHSHTGTHLDAPCHILPEASSLSELGPERFFGRGLRVELRNLGEPLIRTEHLLPLRPLIELAEFVLLHTGWSAFWGRKEYLGGFPALCPEAARWLGGFALKGVGIDTLSVDPVDSRELSAHRELLGRNILIVENLNALEQLGEEPFHFACFALRIRAGDGSPVRAAALVGGQAFPGSPLQG